MDVKVNTVVIREFVPAVPELKGRSYSLTLSREELLYMFCAVGRGSPTEIVDMAKRNGFEETLSDFSDVSDLSDPIYHALKKLALDSQG